MITLCAAALMALAPATDSLAYAVYDAAGRPTTLDAVCDAALESRVLFLGETHDDPTGHALQHVLLRMIAETTAPDGDSPGRPVVLALEMFESDVQLVLDEYLAGLISERDFLAAARPWGNYATDYRPLVETARESGWGVVASNAPARYVRLATREGAGALFRVASGGRATLPPLPVDPPTETLAAAFTSLMGGMMHGGGGPSVEGMLAGQNLRDASMAYWTMQALVAQPRALVVHVNGSFHSVGGQGIPEHLARVAPGEPMLIVTAEPSTDIHTAPAPDGSHFTILTDASRVPSRIAGPR
jgi:uncharacterized iron-regulated protein